MAVYIVCRGGLAVPVPRWCVSRIPWLQAALPEEGDRTPECSSLDAHTTALTVAFVGCVPSKSSPSAVPRLERKTPMTSRVDKWIAEWTPTAPFLLRWARTAEYLGADELHRRLATRLAAAIKDRPAEHVQRVLSGQCRLP